VLTHHAGLLPLARLSLRLLLSPYLSRASTASLLLWQVPSIASMA